VPSMQPSHCTSDMEWAEARLGPKRVLGAYAWRSLLDMGAWIPGGSDAPVESPNPIAGIHAACTRRNEQGSPGSKEDVDKYFQLAKDSRPDPERYTSGWYGRQRMTRLEALRAFTIWAAQASGQEYVFGSLEPGKYADFVVTSADLSAIPDRELPTAKVVETWIGGEKVFPRKKR
jgi:predicted amidohydrolase YtcJ